MLPKQPHDTNKTAQVKAFVGHVIRVGQAQQRHYATLPRSLQYINKRLLDQVQGSS